MKNIVLIPCWRREDFLQTTCDYLCEADGSDNNIYVFLMDRLFTAGIFDVVKKFPLEKVLHRTPNHIYNGNTYNVLEGYKLALKMCDDANSPHSLIYLVEEDIFVGKDFFTFHERVQEKYKSFCVSGVKNQNNIEQCDPDPAAIYYHPKFQSLGISWKAHNLRVVAQHAIPDYYKHRERYLLQRFPKSTHGAGWNEQDGMINRIMEACDFKAIYPNVPRAFHAGFSGYNRPGFHLRGPLTERVKRLKAMTDDEMNTMAREIKDIKREPLCDYGVVNFVLHHDPCRAPVDASGTANASKTQDSNTTGSESLSAGE